MKSLGYALLISGLIGGGIVFCNVFSGLSADKCSRECPDETDALETLFSIGPATLKLCSCGKASSDQGGG